MKKNVLKILYKTQLYIIWKQKIKIMDKVVVFGCHLMTGYMIGRLIDGSVLDTTVSILKHIFKF